MRVDILAANGTATDYLTQQDRHPSSYKPDVHGASVVQHSAKRYFRSPAPLMPRTLAFYAVYIADSLFAHEGRLVEQVSDDSIMTQFDCALETDFTGKLTSAWPQLICGPTFHANSVRYARTSSGFNWGPQCAIVHRIGEDEKISRGIRAKKEPCAGVR